MGLFEDYAEASMNLGNVLVRLKQPEEAINEFKLRAADPTFPDIVPKDGQTLTTVGVVTAVIKQLKIEMDKIAETAR